MVIQTAYCSEIFPSTELRSNMEISKHCVDLSEHGCIWGHCHCTHQGLCIQALLGLAI